MQRKWVCAALLGHGCCSLSRSFLGQTDWPACQPGGHGESRGKGSERIALAPTGLKRAARASRSIRPGLSFLHSPLPCSPAFQHGSGSTRLSLVAAFLPEQRLSWGRGLAGAVSSMGAHLRADLHHLLLALSSISGSLRGGAGRQ